MSVHGSMVFAKWVQSTLTGAGITAGLGVKPGGCLLNTPDAADDSFRLHLAGLRLTKTKHEH